MKNFLFLILDGMLSIDEIFSCLISDFCLSPKSSGIMLEGWLRPSIICSSLLDWSLNFSKITSERRCQFIGPRLRTNDSLNFTCRLQFYNYWSCCLTELY